MIICIYIYIYLPAAKQPQRAEAGEHALESLSKASQPAGTNNTNATTYINDNYY